MNNFPLKPLEDFALNLFLNIDRNYSKKLKFDDKESSSRERINSLFVLRNGHEINDSLAVISTRGEILLGTLDFSFRRNDKLGSYFVTISKVFIRFHYQQ